MNRQSHSALPATGGTASKVAGQRIWVLGAGMVGVCTALELQARGAEVTLVDRRAPGKETSWGNAGVLARSSLVPLNNPGLWRNLPALMGNRNAALRYDPGFLLRNPRWLAGFLSHSRPKAFAETSQALDALIRASIDGHLALMEATGLSDHLSDQGWLMLYRSQAAFAKAGVARAAMAAQDVETEVLSPKDLTDLEPALKPIFASALWIRGTYSVDDPGAIVTGYAKAFADRGGRIDMRDIRGIEKTAAGVSLRDGDGTAHAADAAVICLGPWARQFLETQGYRVPMAFERGYHRHFDGAAATAPNARLRRPVHDTGGGYVLSPMERGLRLSTGVELCAQDAPENHQQLQQAEAAARVAIDLGAQVDDQTWMGCRPTFPDSRPVIGALPGQPNIWASFGHQHIGFSTGPGSAQLLADLMEGQTPSLPATAFRPERFIQAR